MYQQRHLLYCQPEYDTGYNKKDMLYTMEILDQTLDYEGDLAGQVQRMENFTAGNPSRLTLIRTDGTVVSDSDADPAELDNHLSRKEVVQAMKRAVALRNVIPTH